MKICITAKGNTLDSKVEERFGRTPYFIFADEDGSLIEEVANANADATGGVGPRSVQVLIDHNANTLITGQMGGNAQTALETAGIAVYQYRDGGNVSDAIALFKENKLKRIL